MNSGRTRALVVPREHGAWGLLLVPLVTGACVGFLHGHGLSDLILFLTAALALFWVRTPIESVLGSSPMQAHGREEKVLVLQAILVIGTAATLPLFLLLRGGQHTGLLVIALITGAAFALQAGLKKLGRKMRMPAQMIGAIGLTSTAAGAYYVVTNRLDSTAFALWFANWLFAGDQIHYVQLRLHTAKLQGVRNRFHSGWSFLVGQFVMLVVVVLVCSMGYLPLAVVVAFAPAVIRGIVWLWHEQKSLDLQWLGLTELLHAITFGVLMITSFYVPR